MATTLKNLTGFTSGIATDEVGVNAKTIKTMVEPEFRNKVPGITGAARGLVIGPMKKNVTIDGEVSGSTGIMAATAIAAFSPANSTAYFGAGTNGGLYLVKGEVTDSREEGALRAMSAEFEALDGVA